MIAQDFFTPDVGRALAFGATPSRSAAVDTLREIVERFPDRAVSRHASIALAQSSVRHFRVLRDTPDGERGFDLIPPDHETARRLVQRALFDDPEGATESFGRDTYRDLAGRYGDYLTRR